MKIRTQIILILISLVMTACATNVPKIETISNDVKIEMYNQPEDLNTELDYIYSFRYTDNVWAQVEVPMELKSQIKFIEARWYNRKNRIVSKQKLLASQIILKNGKFWIAIRAYKFGVGEARLELHTDHGLLKIKKFEVVKPTEYYAFGSSYDYKY